MNVIETNKYPVRYVAFENPGTIVKSANTTNDRGGREFMVYYEPRQNEVYSQTDGVYGEVVSYQGKGYLLDVHVTVPDGRREQQGWCKCFEDYQEAYRYFIAAINEAKKYLTR